jgi:CRISPR/Cas system-associated exonuclease Cas4 (RecB family)
MLRISKSHIQTYLICPRKFYFQYVVAIPWDFVPVSLPFGSALHEAVAFFYRMLKNGEKPDLAFVLSEFKRTWQEETEGRPIGFAPNSTKESMEGLGVALLRNFYESIQPRKVEAVEYAFSVPLYDPDGGTKLEYVLVGKIDAIESDDEGNLIISELKTSSKRYADSQGENQLDGWIYAYALDQLGFRTDENRTLIRYDVLIKTKTPAFQQVYFNKEAGDYRRLTRWIKEILQAIDSGSFFPNFGWACKQCPFKRACWLL